METMSHQTNPVFGVHTPVLSYRIRPQFVHMDRSAKKTRDLFCMEVLSGGINPLHAKDLPDRHVSVVYISAIVEHEIGIDAGLTLK